MLRKPRGPIWLRSVVPLLVSRFAILFDRRYSSLVLFLTLMFFFDYLICQAAQQLDDNWELIKDRLPDTPTFGQWLNKVLPPQSSVGADPTTISNSTWETISKELQTVGNQLINLSTNLVDYIWPERPDTPNGIVWVLEQKYTGKEWRQKVQDVRDKMEGKGADYLVVTALDEIAWLLNMRGEYSLLSLIQRKVTKVHEVFFPQAPIFPSTLYSSLM